MSETMNDHGEFVERRKRSGAVDGYMDRSAFLVPADGYAGKSRKAEQGRVDEDDVRRSEKNPGDELFDSLE